jgi:ParB family chromosome partitioning protein
LTAEQRKRFVVVDNAPEGMAGEWDFEILEGDWDLPELGELGFDKLVEELGAEEVEAPTLQQGDRAPFRQVTFTLHDEQWEEVEAALAKAKQDGGGESAVNENSNGNALAWICGRFNRG